MPTQGLAPLSRNGLDVLGTITKTVRDAAIAYNVMSGYGTAAFAGVAPEGGYTALLGQETLQGKRIGVFGPGWSTTSLSEPIQALYDAAIEDMVALGAVIVRNAFENGTFADAPAIYGEGFTAAASDFQNYLKGLGISSFAEFVDIVGTNPATPEGPLNFILDAVPKGPDGQPDANIPPDLSTFYAGQARFQAAFNETFDRLGLDALVFPTLAELQPPITAPGVPDLVASPEINIMGVPVINVPSTVLTQGPILPRPFSLAFIGKKYSEAMLLALAYDYEQSTQLRIVPDLP